LRDRRWLAVTLAIGAGASCARRGAPAPADVAGGAAAAAAPLVRLRSRAIPLPGATGIVHLDYLAVDRAAGRIWIPAGETGRVDVIDAATGAIRAVEGFPTSEGELLGKKVVVGPSAVAVGPGVVWIGNRGDGTICAIDSATLRRGACFPLGEAGLATSADGLAYVATTRELWVTTGAPPLGIRPPDSSLVVLDASAPGRLALAARVRLDGAAEGYAVDDAQGVFFTNLEDRDRTVAIDVVSRRPKATWSPGCGPKGPRGLAVDRARSFLFVACTDRVVALDAGHGGAKLGEVETGDGVDNIDYVESRHELFVAAASAALLTVIRVDDRGSLTPVATGATARFARVVVADEAGRAYVADPAGGRILVFER
jgi:DNA-binding beta-propeller fold protein YncE